VLRRLYSTFAGGWPGIGLLLMRLVVGAVVLWDAGPQLWSDPPLHAIVGGAMLAAAGLLLIAGLWTPIGGAVVAVVAIFEILTGEPAVGRLLAATIAGALTMLGPGRWSIDARLFGWKRIDLPVRAEFDGGLIAERHARKSPSQATLSSRLERRGKSSETTPPSSFNSPD
jgi:hypothetical protein